MKMKANEIDKKRIVLEQFIGEDLEQYCERYLGIDFKLALQGVLTEYVQYLIDSSKTFQYQKKDRSNLEFIQELIYSRCAELKLLEKWTDKVVLDGSDKELIICKYATNRPDFFEVNSARHYEVISSYRGFFLSTEQMFLTKEKLKNLCYYAEKYELYVIALDILYQRYTFVPIYSQLEQNPIIPTENGYNLLLKGLNGYSLYEPDMITQRSE